MYCRRNAIPLLLIVVFLALSIYAQTSIRTTVANVHFEVQARSLLQLHLEIIDVPSSLNDFSYFNGAYFSPFGLLPSLLLIPLILLVPYASQHVLSLITFPVSIILVYKIAKKLGMHKDADALWLTIFFNFGTIFLFLALTNISAYIAQVISITLLLAALYSHFSQKKDIITGLFIGLAILTRPIIIFAAIFFLLEIFLRNKKTPLILLEKLSLFLIPIAFCLVVISLFNLARFGNVFDNGYDHNFSHDSDLRIARNYGFFSPSHIPGNIYLLFFKSPHPHLNDGISHVLAPPYLNADHWGLGIFFTSPFFVYLFTSLTTKRWRIRFLLITVGIMLIPMLTFYAYGAWQYGYRHAADIYPFLLIGLIYIFRDGIPLRAKALIMYGILFNLFYMYSMWGIYPFNIK